MPQRTKQGLQNKKESQPFDTTHRKNSSNSCKSVKIGKESNRKNFLKNKDIISKKKVLPETNIFETSLLLPYKNKEISVVISFVDCDFSKKSWIILTHGAGGDLNTPQLKAITLFLTAKNFVVARFTCKGLNIQYRVNVFHEVVNIIETRFEPRNIFIGGRSMGARAAVTLLSQKLRKTKILDKITGVICLSYPLHKVNNTDELRDTVLLELKKPVFFLSGDSDEMCQKHIFEKVLKRMVAPYKIHWLNGYNHSAKSNACFQEEAYFKAFDEIGNWCQDIQ